jgi:hypothetical protein
VILYLSFIDEDSNGTIDREELKKCLQKLQLHMTEEEVEDLFHSCDINGSEGIQFNEFIVLLCLIYLLKEPSSSDTVFAINFLLVLQFITELNMCREYWANQIYTIYKWFGFCFRHRG